MRLIDADKLMLSLADWKLQESPISTYPKPKEFTADDMQRMIWRTIRDCESAVEEQPTLKAIHIDKPFLKMRYDDYVVYNKKWLVNHLQTEWSILQGKEYQPSIPVEWIKKQKVDFQNEDYPFNYCRGFQDGYNDCIDYLVSEWEEENEQTNRRR